MEAEAKVAGKAKDPARAGLPGCRISTSGLAIFLRIFEVI